MPGSRSCASIRRLERRSFLQVSLGLALAAALPAGHARAQPQDFQAWLKDLKAEALAAGLKRSTLDEALDGIQPIARVIELDRKQPEFVLTFREYMLRVVNDARVEKGRRLLEEHKALLEGVGRKFGVQPRFIVALWGIETDFGRLTGGFPVIAALATLAFEGRRAQFFRKELLNALRIVDQGHIRGGDMIGSWAGAMGQSQFMPSSFLSFAVDYDGDGRRDIWTTLPDVFASIANYLGKSGWNADQNWGLAVRLPEGFDAALASLEVKKPLAEWTKLGVRRADGQALPDRPVEASIVKPGNGEDAFAVYDNYRVVMKWNRSLYFATAVGTLADRIGGGS
ncbi:MAG: lytic murein transglycosylase [Rhodospirillales bacterium]